MIWKIFSRMPSDFEDPEDYASECYKRDVIAVGWNELGDVSGVLSRDQLREKVQRKYGIDARAAAQAAGSIWAFYHDVAVGEYILCPDKKSQRVYLGKVAGAASYDLAVADDGCPFANRRKVAWRGSRKQSEVEQILGRRYGGNQTVSRTDVSSSELNALLGRVRRVTRSRASIPFLPDKAWGDDAEARAMQWLRAEGYAARNVANENKGWDIEAGDELFEVKGRRSPSTLVRLTENEWAAAKLYRKRYTLLIFTAADKRKLRLAQPQKFPDPARTESWTERERVIVEYFLDQ
jgi:hypothetical protein